MNAIRSKMFVIYVALALFATSFPAARSTALAPTVDFEIGGCSAKEATSASAMLQSSTGQVTTRKIKPVDWNGGFAHYRLTSPWYLFHWRIKTKNCIASDRGMVTVLPTDGTIRTIVSRFERSTPARQDQGSAQCVAGVVPFDGMRVVARQPGLRESEAIVEGKHFYFNKLASEPLDLDAVYTNGIDRARFHINLQGVAGSSCLDLRLTPALVDAASSGKTVDLTSQYIVKSGTL